VALVIAAAFSVISTQAIADDSAAVAKPAESVIPDPSPLAIKPAVPYAATPLPQADVRLTGGPLKHAQDLDAAYLLELEPDRMLYFLRLRAGLMPKTDKYYGGWDGGRENEPRQLTGHIAGHYLSAVSYMYAATGNEKFKERADYIVNELRDIQNRH